LQAEQLQEKLVLIGSTNYEYIEELRTFIQNKGFVWLGTLELENNGDKRY